MTNPVQVGHNNPPDEIDTALAPYSDAIEEAANWLVGEPVTTQGQMDAVDVILKQIRSAGVELGKAKKSATAPLHDIWKAEIARWKPTEDDLDRIKKGLAALVDPFKRKLAAEKAEVKRKAYEDAQRLEREARDLAAKANAANIEEQREAAAAAQEAQDAKAKAAAANKDTVKGLRKAAKYDIEDHRTVLNWIAVNDRDAVTDFIEAYVAKNHKVKDIDGVKQWNSREAY